MKTVVISGINLFEGGPLSVYKDCLDNIVRKGIYKENKIIIFVHKKQLFNEYDKYVTIIELPKARKGYIYRVWYEYFYFYTYSKDKNIDIWISLHDITPNVRASERYVYCHNPSPFMRLDLKDLRYSYKNFLFSLFYKYLYKINIKKNTAVIVQQDWIRQEFFNLYNINNIIVARPTFYINNFKESKCTKKNKDAIFRFIYPAFPRVFKNFEIICEASKILEEKGISNFEVLLTLDGTENKYSSDLTNKYSNINSVKFIGLQNRENIYRLYNEVDCMIFPSKIETWGLPISEFKFTKKPIIVVRLPYARETIGEYDKVCFFDSNNVKELAKLMEEQIYNIGEYEICREPIIEEPYCCDWSELLKTIL